MANLSELSMIINSGLRHACHGLVCTALRHCQTRNTSRREPLLQLQGLTRLSHPYPPPECCRVPCRERGEIILFWGCLSPLAEFPTTPPWRVPGLLPFFPSPLQGTSSLQSCPGRPSCDLATTSAYSRGDSRSGSLVEQPPAGRGQQEPAQA